MKKAGLIGFVVFFMMAGEAMGGWWWPPTSGAVIVPPNPTSSDVVAITLSGEWPDSCIPNASAVWVIGNDIYFDVILDYPPGIACLTVITSWELTESVGPLPPGTYSVYACLFPRPYTRMTELIVTGPIIYVDADANGANDGSSWANAYNYLQDALAVANSIGVPVEIRVAEGIYKPDQGATVTPGDRTATFQLINGVVIKGGYAGFGEPDPNARDIEAYETILSGDLNGDDVEVANPEDLLDEPSRAENSYHVVTGSGTDSTAVLDGFTITGGNADFPRLGGNNGGGMYNEYGSPSVVNCAFSANIAVVHDYEYGGERGGMYNYHSSPTVANCIFSGNSAWDGGGMYNLWCSPVLTNCTFRANSAGEGGGIKCYISNPTISSCTFSDNTASFGGGIHCSWDSNPMITNCTFSGNSVRGDGGGVECYQNSSPTLTNCTFSGNSAITQRGGGMFCYRGSNPTLTNCTFSSNSADRGGGICSQRDSSPTVTNCIMWGDVATQGDEIALLYFSAGGAPPSASTITVGYSNVEGGVAGVYVDWDCMLFWGDGNIDVDPCFADASSGDYHLKSHAGRWDRTSGSWVQDDVTSSCIDAGDMSSPIGYEPFPNGGVINMGAYGGTVEASKSYFGRPVCEVIVAGDINGDCKVNFLDFRLMALNWLRDENR